MSIIVRQRHFTAAKKIYTPELDGLASIVRGLAMDNARLRIETAAPTAFTDNSTGVATAAPYSFVDMPLPFFAFDATTAGGAQLTEALAALASIDNAHATIGTGLNLVLTLLGLPLITNLTIGTDTTETIPALPKAGTTANGTAAVDFVTGRAMLAVIKANMQKLIRAEVSLQTAVGRKLGTDAVAGLYGEDFGLIAPTAASASASGEYSVSLADFTAFLLAHANNVATLAAAHNAMLTADASAIPLSVVAG